MSQKCDINPIYKITPVDLTTFNSHVDLFNSI